MERVTRIAFLSEHASPAALLGGADAGGQNVYVDEVSRQLGQLGYVVDIFTRRDNSATPEVIEWAPNVRIINLTAGPATFIPKDDLWEYMPVFRDALLNFIEHNETRYDLLHGNFWMSGWVATELQQRLNIPTVQIFHALGKTKQKHQGSADTSPKERIAVETHIIGTVDRIIAQCPSEWSELIEDYDARPERIVTIPAAVNTNVFYPVVCEEARRRIGVAKDAFVVVYVGRMIPRKDVRNVVQGMALFIEHCKREHVLHGTMFPPLQLLLVGGETEEPDVYSTPEIGVLQALANQLGITDSVTFVGKRQQDVLRYYYSAGDVAVTTPWYEPFGLTPLEAMACARPVIGAKVGGIASVIVEGETGYFVPPRNAAAVAERFLQILTEPEQRMRMGQAARQRVDQEFTWPAVVQKLSVLYDSVLTAHKYMVQTPLLAAHESQTIREGD